MFKKIADFIYQIYGDKDVIPLHEPVFLGKEKQYLTDCIDSSFISSVGEYVNRFEKQIAAYTGAKYAIAVVNGTSGLHISLLLSGVNQGTEVITQPLSFIATSNAIQYCSAKPVFIDVDKETMGLSPKHLEIFLTKNVGVDKKGEAFNLGTGNKISACMPMHTFGHMVDMEKITSLCSRYNIPVVEDAAEALGSFYKEKHAGTYGKFGVLSFNGNKIISTGGGGVILTNDSEMARRAKHISTTAKVPHPYEYEHDTLGFNYRMPNINAALGCAQLECLPFYLENKKKTAEQYRRFFNDIGIDFFIDQKYRSSNHWLNAVILKNKAQRDELLGYLYEKRILARPVWKLLNHQKIFCNCQTDLLENAKWLEERVVNLPSSVTGDS